MNLWAIYSILKGTDRVSIKLRDPCNSASVKDTIDLYAYVGT